MSIRPSAGLVPVRLAVMAAVAGLPLPILAADSAAPALEEIVVTAQKRAESLQDVPIAISAFDAGFVERVGILDAKSIINFSPSMAGNQKSSFTDTLTMRGIGSTNFGVGSESAIGIYKDNVYQGRSGSSIASLYDVERIEVLRGPQSFLFGRHATAGAIHVITRKPSPERVEGYVTLGYGEREHLDVEGAINVPFGDDWALRVSGALRQEDGYITNIYPGTTDEVIDYDNAAVRAELARDGERLDVLLTAEYEDRQDTATIYSALDENGNELTGDARTIDSEFGSDHPDHGRITGLSLQLDYDVEFATLTSITGYRGHEWSYGEDSDGLGLRISNYLQNQDGDYWSQEFRLVSTGESRLKWFVGVSAYGEDIDADYGLAGDEDVLCGLFFIGDPSVGCEDAWPLVFGVPFPTTPGILLEQGFVEGTYDGWAAFADVTYSLTDRFDINLGLRYSKDNKEFSMYVPLADSPLAPVFIGYFTPEPIKDDKSWDDLSPRLTLTFRPNDDWTVYASATKGYKAGGFDMFTAVAPNGENFLGGPTPPGTVPNSFGPEEIWSYEAGVKATLFDDRAQLALTAFHYRYTDLQFAAAEELGQLAVRNVGQVDGDGVEFEVRARPVAPLELYLSTAYIDTSVEDVPEATCGLPSCDGNQLPYQSHWKAVAGAAVTAPLEAFGGTELFGYADVQYQDQWFGEISNLPITEEDAYTVLNLRGGLRSADQRWEAALYLDNVTDESWYDGRILLFTGPTAFGPSRPRTFGGTVTYRFGLE